jgi:hypothetical protein
MATTVTVEHDGITYAGQIGTIRSTRLGYEDHGILTANIDITFDGGGIGVGGFCLDEPAEKGNYKAGRRGTAYGLDHIIRFLETVGVDRWEDLPGRQVIVLYAATAGWGGMSVGIASTTSDKVFVLKKHAEAWIAAECAEKVGAR